MLHATPPNSGPLADAAAFAANLQAERDAIIDFIYLLQSEQDILVRGDVDGLATLASDKADKIDLLALFGEQRNRYLGAQNLARSAAGMATWLGRNPGFATAVGKLWRELLDKAETARQINEDNGVLIENRLQQNRHKLAVLQSAAASNGLYQPDGQVRPLGGARSLIQA